MSALRSLAIGLVQTLSLAPVACSASSGEGEGASKGVSSSTETGALEVEVTWLEVAASDYKLELVPPFGGEVTSYEAIADGPDIEVYVDVIVNADLEGVTVNGVPALSNGFRAWRSAPETGLISPTSFVVELPGASAPSYEVEVVLP